MINDAFDFEFFDTVLGYDGRWTGMSVGWVGGIVIRMEGFEEGDMEGRKKKIAVQFRSRVSLLMKSKLHIKDGI